MVSFSCILHSIYNHFGELIFITGEVIWASDYNESRFSIKVTITFYLRVDSTLVNRLLDQLLSKSFTEQSYAK